MSKCHNIFKTWPIAKKNDSLYSTMVANVLIKLGWHPGWHQMITVGGEAFWNFQPHMVLCWEKIQSAIEFVIFGRSPKMILWYFMILSVKFGWNLMKTVEGVVFRKSWNQKFAKCTKWPQTKLNELGIKSTLHMWTVVPWVPNFHPFRSTISRFSDIPHFRFPIDSYVKISNCHKIFKFWQIAKISKFLYSPVTAVFIIKFGPDRMKTVGGLALWNFQPHMVLC